mmetsp:Transcript_35638/g.111903  ORF Transcript_35638/g.111903 Transcript_35638/m.111903 type:complete len:238 (-) Transcript_35638:866-1579(-)
MTVPPVVELASTRQAHGHGVPHAEADRLYILGHGPRPHRLLLVLTQDVHHGGDGGLGGSIGRRHGRLDALEIGLHLRPLGGRLEDEICKHVGREVTEWREARRYTGADARTREIELIERKRARDDRDAREEDRGKRARARMADGARAPREQHPVVDARNLEDARLGEAEQLCGAIRRRVELMRAKLRPAGREHAAPARLLHGLQHDRRHVARGEAHRAKANVNGRWPCCEEGLEVGG